MIIAGDWVILPGGRALENGAVRVNGSRIGDVGTRGELIARYPDAVVRDHPGCVIMPGLVNAHTHLALTALQGIARPEGDLDTWLARVTRGIMALDRNDFAASATAGAMRCLRGGVTVVGDIVYGPESPAAAGDAGLAGVFYWEVLGIRPTDLPDTLARIEFPSHPGSECPTRTRCGLSPHSPYTSGPTLLQAIKATTDHYSVGFAIHVGESLAELELLSAGTGPFAARAKRLAHDFVTPRSGAVKYLDRLGVLDGAVVVHAVHLMPGEAHLLAQKAAGVVLCPRSNTLLGNGRPPIRSLMDARVTLGIGTDSAASNDDLDLFAEARALKAMEPSLTSGRLVRMMTEEGAQLLGLGDTFGRLACGHSADIIAVEVGSTGRPIETVIHHASAEKIRTVISGGIARILQGAPTFPVTQAENAIARVARKAARAIGD